MSICPKARWLVASALLFAICASLNAQIQIRPGGFPNPPNQPGIQPGFPNPPNQLPGIRPGFPNPPGQPGIQPGFPNPPVRQPIIIRPGFPIQPGRQPGTQPGTGTQPLLPSQYSLGVMGKYQRNGLLVEKVVPGSPAAQVRIGPGDVLVSLNNVQVRDQLTLTQVLNNSRGRVSIVLMKAPRGQLQRVTAVLEVAKGAIPEPRFALGINGQFTQNGLVIQAVVPNSPAAEGGLRRGDILLKIDDTIVRNQNDFQKALQNSGGAVVLLYRSRQARRVIETKVRLAANATRTLRLGAVGDFRPEGMFITLVGARTPADRAGLERGDFLLKVDNQVIRSQDDLDDAIEDSGGLATLLVRKVGTGRLKKIEVDLREDRRRR